METLQIKKGKFGYYITFTIENEDESAFDLSGYTITWVAWVPGASSAFFSQAMEIVVAGDGTCRYKIQSDDFDTEGKFYSEVQLTKVGEEQAPLTFWLEILESV